LNQINQINRDSAEKMIQAGELEVNVAKKIPVVRNLEEATRIDLLISQKMLEAVHLEEEAAKLLMNGNKQLAYQKLVDAAKKRNALFTKKREAAHYLNDLGRLQQIHKDMNSLGKRRKQVKRRTLKRRTLKR
jgi:hypothetical protein